jgi:hypothetical protein
MTVDQQLDEEVDRAIVVGVARYPQFGQDGVSSNDLQGPVNDAREVALWLEKEAKAHVTLITSNGHDHIPQAPHCPASTWTMTDRRPNEQDLKTEFESYLSESLVKRTSRLSKRLYIYMAGHGFMPEPRHLALITANALADRYVPNIQATSWIDWFAEQLYFDELVLWMDCCAIRTFSYEGGKPLMKKEATRQDGRAKVFMAFAAGPALATFEGPIGPGGEVRGLFTDRLLRGLRGAAADSSGVVHTSDLIAYLKNQQALVGNAPVSNAPASHFEAPPPPEPVFPEAAELVLSRIELPSYDLKLALPDGATVKIVEYRQGVERIVSEQPVAGGIARAKLSRGIFKAIGPGVEKLFEIGSGTVAEVNLA